VNVRIGENLDIVEGQEDRERAAAAKARRLKRFLGIRFDCCGVYGRAYLNRQGTAYEARCPKCMRLTTFRVGEGGTDARFFTVR
jgi:hypothetical protein